VWVVPFGLTVLMDWCKKYGFCTMCDKLPTCRLFVNLNPWSRVIYRLIIVHQVKTFPAFYGNRRFIAVFSRARHWTLTCVSWIQSTPSRLLSLRFSLILYSIYTLVSSLEGFQLQVCISFKSYLCVPRAPPIIVLGLGIQKYFWRLQITKLRIM
jgi:hypothetical protein